MVDNTDVERFDALGKYDSPSLQAIKEEHLFRYRAASDFLSSSKFKVEGIIDAACGFGYGSQFLGPNYLGMDRSPQAIEAAQSRHPTVAYRVMDLSSANPFADCKEHNVIVSFETIEHLPDPDEFCRACYSYLKTRNGYFIFSAPTVLTRDLDRYHLHDRSASGWRKTAERAGFTIEKEIPIEQEMDFWGFFNSLPFDSKQKMDVLFFLLTHPRYLLARIWQWGIKGKFYWGNQIYFCRA